MSVFWVTGGLEGEGNGTEANEAEGEYKNEEIPTNMGQAWEIDFGSSEFSSKPKKLPRFLSKMKHRPSEEEQTVKVDATPSPASTTRMTKVKGATGFEKGKSLSPRPNYQKSTPTQVPVKSRNALSAPAKVSSKLATTGAQSALSSKSTAQSRVASTRPSAKVTPPSSRVATTVGSTKTQREGNSPQVSSSTRARPTSAPSTALKSKSGFRGSSKSLFSKPKTSPTSASKSSEKSGKKLSSIWKKKGSKDEFKTEKDSESVKGESGGLSVDKKGRRRALSLRTPRRGGGERSQREGERWSAGSKKKSDVFQSGEEAGGGQEGGWDQPTDERGFDSSSAAEGSWGRKQQEYFERLRSQQFSPRVQMTPDVLSPTSKTSDRKLKAVEQWVHEVTLETQQQDVMVENTAQRLPVVTLPAGGREGVVDGECRLAVCPEDMASRKVLDLRRW